MSDIRQNSCCAQPETLVLIEAIPLCDTDPFVARSALLEDAEDAGSPLVFPRGGLPIRSVAIMPCSLALALVEGVGDVVY